jgi:hypothetical protein
MTPRRRPRVETLESRELLNAHLPQMPPALVAFAGAKPALPLSLHGTLAGTHAVRRLGAGSGTLIHALSGNGNLGTLGKVQAGMTFVTTGPRGPIDGVLYLSSDQGTLTLSLRGQLQSGTSHLVYSICGGSGAFVGAGGAGTAELSLGPDASQPGHFGLTLTSAS